MQQVTIKELEKEILGNIPFNKKLENRKGHNYLLYKFFEDKSGIMRLHSNYNWKISNKRVYYIRENEDTKIFDDNLNIYDEKKGIFGAEIGLHPKFIFNICHCKKELNSFLEELGMLYKLQFREEENIMAKGIMVDENKDTIKELKQGLENVTKLHSFLKKVNDEEIPKFLRTLV